MSLKADRAKSNPEFSVGGALTRPRARGAARARKRREEGSERERERESEHGAGREEREGKRRKERNVGKAAVIMDKKTRRGRVEASQGKSNRNESSWVERGESDREARGGGGARKRELASERA